MAGITILPREQAPGRELSEALGSGLQTGLGGLLERLATQRTAEMAATRTGKGLEAILGLNPEQARQAAYAPESVLKEFSKQKLNEPREQAYAAAIQSLFGEPQQQTQLHGQPSTGTETSTSQIPGRLNSQQATQLAKLGLEKQGQEATKARHYEKLYQKQIQGIESEGKAATRAYDITKRMSDVIKRNKAQLGSVVAGKFVPQQWLNKDTQELISLGNDLVLKKAQLGKGVPSRMRLALEELAKPGIWMKPEVAQARLKDIQSELLDDMAETKALEYVQENYGLDKNFNKNLKVQKRKELQALKKEMDESSGNTFQELPPASQFEGKTARNPATGQRMKSVNGQWVEVKE